MRKSIEIEVLTKIKKARKGRLFFAENFTGIGSAKSINKALERLVKAGELHRLATGIYVRPVSDGKTGYFFPGIEEVAIAIAKRDRARIVPTGSYALYKLGLSIQVPLNIVYYTDASSRKVKIGKQTITFKKASARNLAATGEISKLAVQALRTLGKDNVKPSELHHIKMLLKREKSFHLQHDLKLAPEWIRKLIGPVNQLKK